MNDFDQDGHADLAIGIPDEDLNGTRVKNAGGVVVLYGVDYGILGGRSIHAYPVVSQNIHLLHNAASTELCMCRTLGIG